MSYNNYLKQALNNFDIEAKKNEVSSDFFSADMHLFMFKNKKAVKRIADDLNCENDFEKVFIAMESKSFFNSGTSSIHPC